MTAGFLLSFFLWNLALPIFMAGWGHLLAHGLRLSLSIFSKFALGLCLAVFVGGALAALGLFRPILLWGFIAVGLVGGALALRDIFTEFSRATGVFFAMGLAFVGIVSVTRFYVLDAGDDELVYFPMALDLLAQGRLAQPLALRAALGYNGQTVLQAFFFLPGDVRYGAAYDFVLPAVALLAEMCCRQRAFSMPRGAVLLAIAFFLFLLPYGAWNSTPTFLAVLPLGALILDRPTGNARHGWVASGLLIAGAGALRTFWAIPAALIVALPLVTPPLSRSFPQQWRAVLFSAFMSLIGIAPFLLLQWRLFHTPCVQLFGGTVHPDYLRFANENPLVGLAAAVEALVWPEMLALLLFSAGLIFWNRELRAPASALILMAGFVAYESSDLDGSYAVRYSKPFLLTMATVGFLGALRQIEKEKTSPEAISAFWIIPIAGCLLWAPMGAQTLRGAYAAAVANEWGDVYGYWEAVGRAARPIELQEGIPPGDAILALSSFPRHLNFRRNRIFLGDIPGSIESLDIRDMEAFWRSCRSLGIRWVVVSDPAKDLGFRNESYPHQKHRYYQRRWLADRHRFIELNKELFRRAASLSGAPIGLIKVPETKEF